MEWPTFPALLLATSGALAGIVDIAEGMEVDAARMRADLDITHGLIMSEAVSFALAKKIGKQAAHHQMESAGKTAAREHRHLRDVLLETAEVTAIVPADEIRRLFDPAAYQGVSQQLIDRLIAAAQPKP
jgi:3-carboxy-cis,cis-muconate cycloisomerase